MSILTKIRQRPDNQKKIFSLVVAGILTLVIIFVWLSFTNSAVNTQTDNSDKLSSVSPTQAIKDEFSNALSSLKQDTSQVSSSTGTDTIPIEVVESTTTEGKK